VLGNRGIDCWDLGEFYNYSNVPVVFMARDVMIFMRENLFRGPLEGVGSENRDFLGLIKSKKPPKVQYTLEINSDVKSA
jgi:hypothetical protein